MVSLWLCRNIPKSSRLRVHERAGSTNEQSIHVQGPIFEAPTIWNDQLYLSVDAKLIQISDQGNLNAEWDSGFDHIQAAPFVDRMNRFFVPVSEDEHGNRNLLIQVVPSEG